MLLRAFRSGFRSVGGLALAALAGLLAAPVLNGHEGLMSSVLHEIEVVVGATNIDVTVDLTFREGASFAERRVIDANRDGRLAPEEIRRYLAAHQREWEAAVKLSVVTAGAATTPPTALPLILLHNPDLDLRGIGKVGLAPHELRLQFFARTPPGLRPEDRLVIDDPLWAHLPAQHTFRSSGRDGWSAEPTADPDHARPATNGPTSVRCTARLKMAASDHPKHD